MKLHSLQATFALTLGLALPSLAPAQTWTVVPSPNPPGATQVILRDVSVIAEDDAWAVGHWRDNAFQEYTLAMHWDGTAWTIVPTPSPPAYPGSTYTHLNAVHALAADDVWAGGVKNVPGQSGFIGPQMLVMHWDGSSWSEVSAPYSPPGTSGARVSDITALSPSELLFVGVGFSDPLGGTRHPLAMHWDGSNFSIDVTPIVGSGSTSHEYTSVLALSANEVFTAGRVGFGSACGISRILDRYDGQDWTTSTSPEPGWQHCFYGIDGVASDDVWAAGSVNGPNGFEVLTMHWDGSAWSQVPAPGGGEALLAFSSSDVLMGGNAIYRWNGAAWLPEESFSSVTDPGIRAMDHVGARGVWAVGQQRNSTLNSFIARRTEVGTTFCDPALPNCLGASTTLSANFGSGVGSDLHLTASHGPANEFGYFIVSAGMDPVGFSLSRGQFCLLDGVNPFGRFNQIGGAQNSLGKFSSDGATFFNLVGTGTSAGGTGFDVPSQLPLGGSPMTAGSTWNFQLWHRDSACDAAGSSNLSNGLSVLVP